MINKHEEAPLILPVVVYDKTTGFISSAGTTCFPELLETEASGIIAGASADVMGDYVDVATKQIKPKGPRPLPHHTFDYVSKTWVDLRTLDDLKYAKWEGFKTARDAAEFGGFIWDGSRFDSDAISQSRIQGAVQLAAMAPGFSLDWTLADNSIRTLNAADMAAVGAALGAHVAILHADARELRTQINAATTAAQLDGIRWPASIV
ncbi:hypothetical protein D3C71_1469430 [compost metagenome]